MTKQFFLKKKGTMAEQPEIGEEAEYEEDLDEKPKNMILQLKTGMDLSKVSSFLNPQWSPTPLLHATRDTSK
jgi:hypothetical protein